MIPKRSGTTVASTMYQKVRTNSWEGAMALRSVTSMPFGAGLIRNDDFPERPVETEKGFVPFVFVSPRTMRAYEVVSISLAFAAAARRAKVEGVSFHTLRHTAVSRMV